MSKSIYKLLKILQVLAIFILVLLFLPYAVLAKQAMIKKIQIQDNPLSVKIFVTQKVPVKLIQVEKKEILVAFKNVKLEKGFKIKGNGRSAIKDIAIENLQGNVMAVILTGYHPYGYIKSGFNISDLSFFINLEKKDNYQGRQKKVVKKSAVKSAVALKQQLSQKEKAKENIQSSSLPGTLKDVAKPLLKKPAKILTGSVHVPSKREKGKYNGEISDLVHFIEKMGCDSKQIANCLLLLKKNLYEEASDVLDQYVSQENFTCLEQVSFLKAYAFYLGVKKGDFNQLVKAQRFFQDALVSYPDSSLVPYGYASIGMIQKKINNISVAEGYFNIVKQGYPEYSGLAEILYNLADIYDQKGYEDKALTYYKKVFEDTMENSYIPDAGIGYGKALFKKRQYLDALKVLNYVVQSNPGKVYASHELLLHIGNADFEVGRIKTARQTLTRVLNLFPEIEDRDLVLSKIGDTYGMENNHEKAIRVYELVREKFPDSQGYIASSIGIARYLKEDQEKIDIYTMIKNKFPENKFARISMMRLAEIYQANGEYNKCITEIEDLLSTHPRGLRYEAVKLMQKAYEELFEKQLKSDEYTKVLNRYELEHTKIDKMGSKKIALSVGLAYLQAKLYEESFNHLINAYKQYKRSSRSPELLFGLGVAMDESGRDDDAIKLFDAFSKRFSEDTHRVEALLRAGDIYLAKEKYKLSSASFNEACKISKTHLDKGKILMLHSNVYEKKGDMDITSNLREKAVKELALASGENYEVLTHAYKQLGGTYRSLKKYIKSADAYLKALSFSENDRERATLGFLLGDAYQKGNIIPKAKAAFKQVVTSYDSVWAKLSQQRLNTLELAQMLQNS
ncbi:tetratricopeptide repeat protein [Desulfobacula phenolica]|uniref:Tetratricopeptide repeat-containing protein n=1 Tax=Desulfobacula phenolica TaxID=90732 RepID=A0A1H2DSV4_9BACT|nr:tetratricopeptide repeat protein [Desulfobacula phenolica]SDT85952.1 Tetratricopeptide repeat-containing protein [Desulfobacula phenolica]